MTATNDNLKVISFQHKSVIDSIEETGIYLCSHIGEYHKNTPKTYDYVKKEYQLKTYGSPIINPIFGWSQVSEVDFPVDETNPEDIKRMLEMTGRPEDYHILIMEVPITKVIETDFYGFVGLRFDEEFEDVPELSPENKGQIFRPRQNKVVEIQTIMGFILKDWVKTIKPLTQVKRELNI